MADKQLLSRRQILALFGTGTGMAIIGAQGQQTESVDGNVLGGADNMPAPYKVGESTYKGPLSVRSEIPQEDGITFIQTDAGSANDQFALHHYNGGWSQQGLNTTSLDTEKAQINNGVTVSGQGNVLGHDRLTFALAEREVTLPGTDPVFFSHKYFDDDQYRFLTLDGGHVLRKTPDFSSGSFTSISTNILSGTGEDCNDAVRLSDGRWALYLGSGGGVGTNVWVGEDLTNLTDQGEILANYGDLGAFVEDGTVHLFTEGDPAPDPDSPTTDTIRHYTAPEDNLTNTTFESVVIDVSSRNWYTGDADIWSVGDRYYMSLDRLFEGGGTNYRMALATSDNLYSGWEIQSQNITGPIAKGGDLTVERAKDGITWHGATEFSRGADIRFWTMFATPIIGDIAAPGGMVTINDAKLGNKMASIGQINPDTYGMAVQQHPAGNSENGFWLFDDESKKVGNFSTGGSEVQMRAVKDSQTAKLVGDDGGTEVRATFADSQKGCQMRADGSTALYASRFQRAGIPAQDLSQLDMWANQDGDLFHHDGSNSVTLTDGSTQSDAGYYRWVNDANSGSGGWSYLG